MLLSTAMLATHVLSSLSTRPVAAVATAHALLLLVVLVVVDVQPDVAAGGHGQAGVA